MKNLKILSRKELKAIEGGVSISKCPSGSYYCLEAAVCIPINAECYIIVPDIPVDGEVSH